MLDHAVLAAAIRWRLPGHGSFVLKKRYAIDKITLILAMKMKRVFDWDVFISHNRLQKPWVRKLVNQWRQLGVRVFFDEDSIEVGEQIVAGIERGLNGSRQVVLIISPAAVKSKWVAMEVLNSILADPDASNRRIIPVLLEPTKPNSIRLSLNGLNRIDLTDPLHRRANYSRLMKSINVKPPFPNPPPWSRPVRAGTRAKQRRSKMGGATRFVEVILDTPFEAFSAEEQSSFLESVRQLLRNQNVKIISKRPGSVKLRFALSAEQARRVLDAVEMGYFKQHRVSEAKLLTKTGVTTKLVTVAALGQKSAKALTRSQIATATIKLDTVADSGQKSAKALTRSQIAAAIAEKNNVSKSTALGILEQLADLAYKNAKNSFTLPGVGKLVLVNRKARIGRNPETGKQIQIPAKRVVKFRVAKAAKDAILGRR